jgi:hypothetical protein
LPIKAAEFLFARMLAHSPERGPRTIQLNVEFWRVIQAFEPDWISGHPKL